jgi:hypothetical protein
MVLWFALHTTDLMVYNAIEVLDVQGTSTAPESVAGLEVGSQRAGREGVQVHLQEHTATRAQVQVCHKP